MLARLKPKKPSWGTFAPAFYWWATYALRGILWVVARWDVRGRENVPAEGPVIVVSNHLNNADPPILAAGIARRRIHFMAKIELFKYPFGVVPRLYGAFPVRRFDSDLGALLSAERLLKKGGVLGMFPEGTRSRNGYIGTPHPGTALIALRSGATVVPCAMAGTEGLRNPLIVFRKPRMSVVIGAPILVEKVRRPTEEQISALTGQIFDAIKAMVLPQYLPPYTGTEGQGADGRGDDHSGK
jgi:1-acyl-sn-glycerol-3-phosphate acyltransferase